ncbi:LytR/AlgR family response regulator transcription factor [Flavobacterium sp. ARAG 55.4]|uniref:LytR/AlgR family response regulator transcription factor n=1 Tax=Flavobacterium sp. ARAG 55.4 TaxID=3451357 RepID=UPI003F4748AF
MLTCIIIEDQPPAQRILQKYIAETPDLLLKNKFTDVLQAKIFLETEHVDIIFLDIHLPKISGMSFLRTYENCPAVILTTAYSDYALESYEYNVKDYLLKPFSYERFLQAVSKVYSTFENDNEPLFIKSGYDLIKIKQQDIIYIKSDGDYTEVYALDKMHLSSDSLKQWLDKLNEDFCQIHKSFIVNINYSQKISGNKLFILNDTILPIGRAYKKYFVKKYIE